MNNHEYFHTLVLAMLIILLVISVALVYIFCIAPDMQSSSSMFVDHMRNNTNISLV